MTELEQRLRKYLRSHGLPEFEISEVVEILQDAYELGFDRGKDHGEESMRVWLSGPTT